MHLRLALLSIGLAWLSLAQARAAVDPLLAPEFCRIASLSSSSGFERGRAAYAAGEIRAAIAYLGAFVTKEKPVGGSRDLLPALELLARSYKVIGCNEEAILRQREHRELAQQRGNAEALCRSDSRLARLLLQRDSEAAERLATLARPCALLSGDTETVSEVLSTLAARRIGQSKFDEADKLLDEAIETARTPLMRAEGFRFRGVLRTQQQPIDLVGAAGDFERSLKEAQMAGDPEALVLARIYRADVNARTGADGPDVVTRRRETEKEAALSEEEARRRGMRRAVAVAALLSGSRRMTSEEFSAAQSELVRARKLYNAVGDYALARAVAFNLANLLWQLGKEHFDAAIEAALDSQRLALNSGYPAEAAKVDHTLGLIALDQNQSTRARNLFLKYLQVADHEGTLGDRARVLNDLARVDLYDDDVQSAIRGLNAAAPLALAAGDLDLQAAIDTTRGWALDRAKQSTDAQTAYYRALNAISSDGGGLRRAGAYWGLARTQVSSRPAVAIAYYKAAAHELEAVVRNSGIPNIRAPEAFGQRYSDMYRELAALLVSQSRPAEAQRMAELMQQQELREKRWLSTRAEQGVEAVELTTIEKEVLACQGRLLERFRAWLDKCNVLRQDEGSAKSACDDGNSVADPSCADDSASLSYCKLRREVAIEKKDLNRELEDCLDVIQGRLATRKDNDAETFLRKQFQGQWQRATDGTPVTLIVTVVQDNALHVLVSRRPFDGFLMKTHVLPKAELAKLANDIQMSMANVKTMKPSEARKQLSKEAARLRDGSLRKLHDLIIAPFGRDALRADGKGIPVLAFALDGVLRGLPMAALFDGKRYLVDDFAIVVVTPMTVAAPPRNDAAKQALVMGVSETEPPLPHVANEVREVATRLNQTPYLNKDATEQRFTDWLEHLDRPALALHLASHGVFGGTKTSTKIMLWQRDEVSGEELERLRSKLAKVRIFTISACQTAQSLDDVGFGLAGIAERGARSVVGSLWAVADYKSTTRLMGHFYARIVDPRGAGAAEALQSAQLAIRRDFEHPYFWAPFVLVGRWD